jgi:peptidoglycan/LPS O-acetylase OafA/YrhL
MFLVLSGYLITGLLYNEAERTRTIAIGRFYGRRMMRLTPAVVFTVFIFIAVGFIALPQARTENLWRDAASIFTYSANFWESVRPMAIFGHFWSLSLEEQFYFLWPLLMLVLVGRVSTRKLVWSLVVVAVASYLLGVTWYEAAPSHTAWIMTMLPTRGFGLFVGSALALAVKSGMLARSPRRYMATFAEQRGRWCLAIMVLWLILFRAAPLDQLSILGGTLVISLSTAFVVLHATSGIDSLNRILANSWMVTLGVLSCSLYLVHQPIFVLFDYAGWTDFVREPVMIAVSVAAAVALHLGVERPFPKRRDRFGQPAAMLDRLTAVAGTRQAVQRDPAA